MDEFRRKKQISDEDINAFKEMEINEILSRQNKNDYNFFNRKNIFMKTAVMVVSVFIIIFFIGFGTGDDTQPDDYLNIIKVSASEYKVESGVNGNKFFFYYKAYIVYENEYLDYNDQFLYNMKYSYATLEHMNNVTIDFDIIRIDDYRYFLKTVINGEDRYTEINYFPGLNNWFELKGLEIDDFDTDLSAIFKLIEEYPPQYIGIDNKTYKPKYEINSGINNLSDSKAKRNYIYYVRNYYENENFYNNNEGNDQEWIQTFAFKNMIILDNDGSIKEDYFNNTLYAGSHVPPDKWEDVVEDSFDFYDKNTGNELLSGSSYLKGANNDIEGRLSDFYLNDQRFAYVVIPLEESSIDLSSTTYAITTYQLHGIYQNDGIDRVVKMNTFTHNDNLIIPPIYIIDEDEWGVVSLFKEISIEFYDSNDNLIYKLDSYNFW